jgi:tetratricopeptide (TPR) repeat protein
MRLYRTASRSLKPWTLIIALAAVCCIFPASSAEEKESEARALELYGQGRYGDALPLLEELDRKGLADGPLLYRLYYCQRRLKAPDARQTQERARLQLESELGDATDLETPFYLANVYRNIGRLSDMRRVALEATGRVESGDLPRPESAVAMFQLGKLYADQEKETEAAKWYSRSIEGLTADGQTAMPPYAAWAARYLAERAQERGDHDEAAKYFGLLSPEGSDSIEDLEGMAIAAVRAGRYVQASEAWRRAERLDPARADRSRYCARLATAAGQLGGLPELTADGRQWRELSQEELQAILSGEAERVRDTLKQAIKVDMLMRDLTASATEALGRTGAVKKLENSFETVWGRMIPDRQAVLDGARALFVAASLEFAIKRYGLRETAFFGGYASLIFGREDWDLATRLHENMAHDDAEERASRFQEQADELIEAAEEILGQGKDLSKLKRNLGKVRKKMP